jgi:hypothetical protein
MTQAIAKAQEWRTPDLATFRNEIIPANRPAVLRGLIRHWPAVQAGLQSPRALCDYLKSFDSGRTVDMLLGDPSIQGRFFYRDDLAGLNFERRPEHISAVLDLLLKSALSAKAPAISIQSTALPDFLPHFADQNFTPFADASAIPRIWIGNAITVATHYDISDNIACVVGGRRRFTFFPPDQIGNLYVGPIHFTPAGQPVSMVCLEEPDLVRYPRYRQALATAQSAELEPGDAVYIPYFWWHHVKSLEPFNVLVNYWWDSAPAHFGSPYDCLLHGFLTLRHLPPNQRAAWRAVFDHYVFQTDADPMAHLPPERRGALAPMTAELAAHIKSALLKRLQRP